MPKQVKDNIELICMALTIMTAVAAVAYKAHDIDDLKKSHEELRKQVDIDHDTLTEMATDVKWIRRELEK